MYNCKANTKKKTTTTQLKNLKTEQDELHNKTNDE